MTSNAIKGLFPFPSEKVPIEFNLIPRGESQYERTEAMNEYRNEVTCICPKIEGDKIKINLYTRMQY